VDADLIACLILFLLEDSICANAVIPLAKTVKEPKCRQSRGGVRRADWVANHPPPFRQAKTIKKMKIVVNMAEIKANTRHTFLFCNYNVFFFKLNWW